MLPNKQFTPQTVAALAWRKRWYLAIPFAVGLALVPMLAGLVPQRYESETLIMVIPQRVPDSYVKATVTERVEDRLPTISAQILSRSRLERIIEEFNLYPDLRKNAPMEDVVRRMRADIKGPTIEGTDRESFRLSYSGSDPATAHKVTDRLASLYLEQNLQDRTNRADSTSQFLESALQDAKARLVEHERKLEEFSKRYSGQLPTQLAGNLQVIQNTQAQLQVLSESMNRARERRLLYERQLADAQLPLPVTTGGPATSANATAAERLEAATLDLERGRRRYKPDHPEIAALERVVRQWQEKADEEARSNAAQGQQTARAISPAEAERQKRIRSLEAEIEVIDRQLTTSQEQEQRIQGVLASYKANVEAVPTRESELLELNRGYSVLKAAHDDLLLKRENSKIAADLERGQIGEQFSVIDRASLPQRPHNESQRLRTMAMGPAVGLLVGLLLVALLEVLNSTFRTETDVHRALQLPVLANVPLMREKPQQRAHRFRTLALDLTTVLLLVGSASFVALWRLQG